MKIYSLAFQSGAVIPAKFTCDAENISPELVIEDVPKNSACLALIMDDPDASRGYTFTHWLVWNIPRTIGKIPAATAPADFLQGENDFPQIGYGGPCPPSGKPHRYFFRLYALDASLGLPNAAKRSEFDAAVNGHVIESSEYMGIYERP